MIDHLSVAVKDFAASVQFYTTALGPLGYQVLMSFPGISGIGADNKPDFWIAESSGERPPTPAMHLAFRANTRAAVDAFYAAARAAGAADNGSPGVRAHYHPNYYGAFVIDPNGHNLEVVCHLP